MLTVLTFRFLCLTQKPELEASTFDAAQDKNVLLPTSSRYLRNLAYYSLFPCPRKTEVKTFYILIKLGYVDFVQILLSFWRFYILDVYLTLHHFVCWGFHSSTNTTESTTLRKSLKECQESLTANIFLGLISFWLSYIKISQPKCKIPISASYNVSKDINIVHLLFEKNFYSNTRRGYVWLQSPVVRPAGFTCSDI